MNQYNEISTLQYMGSKARIISHICDPIIKNKPIRTVVDLFAGTGAVGYALKTYKNIISNDIEYYAWLMISYSDNSIVNITDIQTLAEKQYDVLIEKVELSHSKQGRSSTSKVDEFC